MRRLFPLSSGRSTVGQRNEFNRGAAVRSVNRREFVRGLRDSDLATTVSIMLRQRAWARASDHCKVVVVLFGGGARVGEFFAPGEDGQSLDPAGQFLCSPIS